MSQIGELIEVVQVTLNDIAHALPARPPAGQGPALRERNTGNDVVPVRPDMVALLRTPQRA